MYWSWHLSPGQVIRSGHNPGQGVSRRTSWSYHELVSINNAVVVIQVPRRGTDAKPRFGLWIAN